MGGAFIKLLSTLGAPTFCYLGGGEPSTSSSSAGRLTFDDVFSVGRCYLSYFSVGSCYLNILPVGESRYFIFFSGELTFDDAFSGWKLFLVIFCGESCYLKILPVGGSRHLIVFCWKVDL